MTAITELPKLVAVFGGSGFVGRHVVRALAKRGYRVRVACRRPDLAFHLQPLGNVGQIQPIQANIRVRWSVDRAIEDADHVVNLVGLLFEAGKQRFAAVHDSGARNVAEAAKAARDRHHPRLGDRRRRRIPLDLRPHQGRRRTGRAGDGEGRCRLPAVDHLRPRGFLLQPLRRHGALFAGAAAGRRRHQVPAGLRRRRRRGDRPLRRRQGQGRPDLRARRARGDVVPHLHGGDAEGHRPPAPPGRAALVGGRADGRRCLAACPIRSSPATR